MAPKAVRARVAVDSPPDMPWVLSMLMKEGVLGGKRVRMTYYESYIKTDGLSEYNAELVAKYLLHIEEKLRTPIVLRLWESATPRSMQQILVHQKRLQAEIAAKVRGRFISGATVAVSMDGVLH